MRLITLNLSAFSLYLNGLAICKKNCSFLMILTLLCVFSVIPARAGYHFTSITAATDSSIKDLVERWSYTSTDPSAGNIYIQGSPTPFSGTYTYTYTWENDNDGANPPSTVYFKEKAQAVGTGNGVSADDGLGDACTNPYGGTYYNYSQGTHYVGMAGTSIITIVVKPSIKASGSGTGYTGYTLSVTTTSKGGYISTSLGGTCHKGDAFFDSNNNLQYAKVNDTYDSSGAFQANTVMPADGTVEAITYSANAVGAWAPSSTWLLHPKSYDTDYAVLFEFSNDSTPYSPNDANSGTFDCDYNEDVDAGNYSFPYANDASDDYGNLTSTIFASGGSMLEHVKMTLTDSDDGSICGENYDLTFHKPLENLIDDPNNPPSLVKVYTNYDGSHAVTTPSDQEIPNTITWTWSKTDTISNSWALGFGLTVGEAVQLNPSITYTTTSSTANTGGGSTSHIVPAGETAYPWLKVSNVKHNMIVDQYGTFGYAGTSSAGSYQDGTNPTCAHEFSFAQNGQIPTEPQD